jgi:hypothetical protein
MYLPYSFAQLIKDPTHLREGTRDIVHQGRNSLSSSCVQI